MERARNHLLKGIIVTGFILGLLFPIFLPNSPTAGTEPVGNKSGVQADTPVTGKPVVTAVSPAATDNTEPEFPVGKIVIFAGLLAIVVVAFLKWGFGNADKTAEKKDQ